MSNLYEKLGQEEGLIHLVEKIFASIHSHKVLKNNLDTRYEGPLKLQLREYLKLET